jgi:hypothetical protein
MDEFNSLLSSVFFRGEVASLKVVLNGYAIAVVATSVGVYWLYVARLANRITPPPIVTWGLWCVLDVIATGAEFARGVFNTQLVTYTIGTVVVCAFLLARRNLAWNKVWDTATAFAVAASAVVWAATDDPFLGLVLSLTGMTIASIPLILATMNGADEPWDAWALIFLGSVFTYLEGHHFSATWVGSLQLIVLGTILYGKTRVAASR